MPTTELAEAVERLHGGRAQWLATVPVVERHGGEVVWSGEVQVFALFAHPTATRCYAWSHETDGGSRKFYAVLHAGPVDSPVAAVRASILKEFRHREVGGES